MIGLRVGAVVLLSSMWQQQQLLLLLPTVWVVRCIGAGVCWLTHGVHCLGAVWASQGGPLVKHRMHIPQPGARLITRPKGILKHLSLQQEEDSVGAAGSAG